MEYRGVLLFTEAITAISPQEILYCFTFELHAIDF
jgi:hypothetical protein